jgi:type II secretory pathway component PulK
MMMIRPTTRTGRPREGFVLLAVLVVIVVLSLAAYQYGELMTAEYRAASQGSRAAQAKALADSGIYYACGALADANTMSGTLGGNPFDNPTSFRGIVVSANDTPYRQGRFTLIVGPDPDAAGTAGATPTYGAVDESGKINLNALLQIDSSGQTAYNMLMLLPNMTDDIANAIIDWLDPDDTPRENGAESDYYQGLNPPYRAKNGPLNTLDELLLVRGVTPQLLFGNDRNRNGVFDADEDDGTGMFDPGWLPYITVYSRELNVDSTGAARIYLNDSDLTTLQTNLTDAVGAELAAYILAYRVYGGSSVNAASNAAQIQMAVTVSSDGKVTTTTTAQAAPAKQGTIAQLVQQMQQVIASGKAQAKTQISSVYQLVNSQVTVPASASSTTPMSGTTGSTSTSSANQTATQYLSPLNDTNSQKQYLPILLDKTTPSSASELPPRVNVNTAPQAVLTTLPGLTFTDVQTIMERRPTGDDINVTDATYNTTSWLLTDANITPGVMQVLDRYCTGRTQMYRVQSVGYFDKGGPVGRVEAVIDLNLGRPRIVYYRDLSDLGRGFDSTLLQP